MDYFIDLIFVIIIGIVFGLIIGKLLILIPV